MKKITNTQLKSALIRANQENYDIEWLHNNYYLYKKPIQVRILERVICYDGCTSMKAYRTPEGYFYINAFRRENGWKKYFDLEIGELYWIEPNRLSVYPYHTWILSEKKQRNLFR